MRTPRPEDTDRPGPGPIRSGPARSGSTRSGLGRSRTARAVRPRAAVRRAAAGAALLVLVAAPGLLDLTRAPGTAPVSRAESAAPDAPGDAAAPPETALLELDTPDSWQAWRGARDEARRARRSAGDVRRAAAGAGERQRRAVEAAADRTARALEAAVPGARVLYRTASVVSGLAVRVPADRLGALRGLPGVRAVHPISRKYRANTHSVPLTGSPAVWAGSDAVPGNTGRGVTIGVVDSGIDYTHADFGGPGTPEAYRAVDGSRPAPAGLFPNVKVVGGRDLVGDDYNTDPAEPPYQPDPHPDANPLDCTANGHGTHVAGTAAGYGVTRDGRTYTGPYRPGLDPAGFRVGPGVAPGASLYALRVFGCHGSTDEIAHALDLAADPNQDGDFSDRLDVVNLSLGGSFGDPGDGDAVAADRLAAAGTVVVASAGNDGDVYGIGSSPAVASRAIAVAASVDGHTDADGIRVLPPRAAPEGSGPVPGPAVPGPAVPGPAVPAGPAPVPAAGSAPAPVPPGPTPAPRAAGAGPAPAPPGPTPAAPGSTPAAPAPAVAPGEPDPTAAGTVVPAHWSSKYPDWETRDVTGELALPADDADGCAPFGPADAARLRGRVAVLAWTVRDADRACGSTARADHAADAGAVGVVLAADGDQTGEISGDTRIPAVIVARADGERLRAAAASGDPVRVRLAAPGNTLRGSVAQDRPERADTLAGFSSRGNGLPGLVKPDVTAPGETILSAQAGSGSGGVRKDGTSMSAPHVAGAAALVRAARPSWTPEQVKAALMDTAGADLTTGEGGTGAVYGPERVGAGRIRADLAVRTLVVAAASGAGVPPGAVGVSFGEVAATAPVSLTREVEVRNLGDRPVAYRTGYRAATAVPGASYAVEPAAVSVPAGGTAVVRVTLRIPDPAALEARPDPTLDPEQAGHARVYRPEASGRLVLTPEGGDGLPELRVPVLAAPHAASRLTAALVSRLPADGSGRPGLLVRIDDDPRAAGRTAGTAAADAPSLLGAFALGAEGARWPDCGPRPPAGGADCAAYPADRAADLHWAGAASDAPAVAARGGDPLEDGTLYLAAVSWAAAPTPVGRTAVRASLDTDGDGRTDAVVEADRLPGSDVLVARTLDAATGTELDVQPLGARWGAAPGLLDSGTVVLPVRLAALPGLRQSTALIRYALWTGPAGGDGVPDVRRAYDALGLSGGRPALTLDVLHPALDVRAGTGGPPAVAVPEGPGMLLEVRRDPWAYDPWAYGLGTGGLGTGGLGTGGLGGGGLGAGGALLVVHQGNTDDRRAQVVPLPLW
ncbi:S8 family serine peptidase [Streptacidiphilus sp. ASG 303]|uniref:S8 family serine peptidase n=1 Tax=Streptacidiphilus sp. ASG 303 TaxID=2896847 RepID=UPI001E6210D6|nr:S8 family serine peptidase [Streptacidiphilus sp. ASG 303]MCD0483060.1 S8 family serine peptidase [Streptacidiphilus sp. ASG 303]